jgi:hypothetical protein
VADMADVNSRWWHLALTYAHFAVAMMFSYALRFLRRLDFR